MTTSPTTGVVDSNGHVFGVDNLIVADITVAPLSPLGNCMAIAYLVANIISDKLLNKTTVTKNLLSGTSKPSKPIKPVNAFPTSVNRQTSKITGCPYMNKTIREKIAENMERVACFGQLKGCLINI
jgi:hypothetical protein